ncbi:MAG: hypothetical protein EA384_16895 [Spirochaetaceae bacterium]|nr:MAG: hypothetical protein EA384_16895 [Spirochaetaceae bacterium]
MFCLYLHVDGFRQLTRIRPSIVQDLVVSVDQVLSRSGATALRREAGDFLHHFPRSNEADHRQVLDAALSLHAELERYGDELHDFSVVIDYLGNRDPAEVFRRLRGALGRLVEQRSIWIGPGAAPWLATEVEVSRHGDYLRIENAVCASGHKLADCSEFLRNGEFVTAALDGIQPWLNGNEPPGVLLVSCEDRVYARENVRHTLRDLYGSAADGRWITLYPSGREDESVDPIANGIVAEVLPGVGEPMKRHEYLLWQSVGAAVEHIAVSPTQFGLFDGLEADVLAAFTLYLTALFRRLQRDLLPPVLVLENLDLFPVDAVRLVRQVYDRLVGEFAPIVVAVSAKPVLPVGMADLVTVQADLPLFGANDVTDRAVRFLSESAERHIRITDCCRRTHGLPLELYFHFVNVQDSLEHAASTRYDVQQQADQTEAAELLPRLTQDERDILAIAALVGGHAAGSLVAEIVIRLGYDQLRLRQVARRLAALGLMRDSESLYVDTARVREAALSSGGVDRAQIETAVARALLSIVAEGGAHMTPALLSVAAAGSSDWVPGLRDLLRHALDGRRFQRVAKVLAVGAELAPQADRPEVVAQILATAELRYALLQSDRVRADQLFETRSAFHAPSGFEKSVEADTALEHARYAVSRANYPQAMALCKRAIMLYQEADDTEGVCRANFEFGSLLLAQEKIGDARDYFVMARPNSDSVREEYTAVRARCAELVCLFLAGELTRVGGQVDALRAQATAGGMHAADLFLQLLHGRVRFELGQYDAAQTTFQRALCDAAIYGATEARRVLRAWSARCLIYLDDPHGAVAALSQLSAADEVRFFRAEAFERAGEAERALLELKDQTTGRRTTQRSPELVAWDSGFAAIEDRAVGVLGGDTVLGHLIKTFRAYLVALTGEPDAGIAEFHHLTRKEKISAADPYNRLYYYLYSQILPRPRNPDYEDPLTILGKSVKYMQERSSRIDEYRDKRSFLSDNYWNRKLLDSARSHNLL